MFVNLLISKDLHVQDGSRNIDTKPKVLPQTKRRIINYNNKYEVGRYGFEDNRNG